MKECVVFFVLTIFSAGTLFAQATPYRVVFDITSRDTLDQKAVLRWIGEITSENPKAQLEVVMYGKGYELVMPEKSSFVSEVNEKLKNPNVSFRVCQIAMRNNHITKDQLLPGVGTVPDGIYEIITKQREEWGYIKVGH
jgi:hypothetical protein